MRSVFSSGSGKIDGFLKFRYSSLLFVRGAVDDSTVEARRKAFPLSLGLRSVFIGQLNHNLSPPTAELSPAALSGWPG